MRKLLILFTSFLLFNFIWINHIYAAEWDDSSDSLDEVLNEALWDSESDSEQTD